MIPPELDNLLRRQETFEALRSEALLKFSTDLCDLSYANPFQSPREDVLLALHDTLAESRSLNLQYTPYGGSTTARRLIATDLREKHSLPFRWKNVILTPGAMAALNVLIRAAPSDGKNEVVVVSPCWLDHPLYVTNLGLKVRAVSLNAPFLLDLQKIEASLSESTCAILISQPGNPSARVYSDSELRELGSLLSESAAKPLLISDECHRDYVREGTDVISPIRYYDRTCIAYSFGKKLGLQGQRLGYAAVSPSMPEDQDFSRELERWCRVMGFCTPTALMQNAVPKLLRISPDIEPIHRWRERYRKAFSGAGIEYIHTDATFFLYASTGKQDDLDITARLAEKGVLVLPGAVFHHSGYIRISFTGDNRMLERALPVLLTELAGN